MTVDLQIKNINRLMYCSEWTVFNFFTPIYTRLELEQRPQILTPAVLKSSVYFSSSHHLLSLVPQPIGLNSATRFYAAIFKMDIRPYQ